MCALHRIVELLDWSVLSMSSYDLEEACIMNHERNRYWIFLIAIAIFGLVRNFALAEHQRFIFVSLFLDM